MSNQNAVWLRKQDVLMYKESESLEATLVQVPYKNDRVDTMHPSMLVILPSEQHRCDLPNWIKKNLLKWSTLIEEVNSMKSTSVELQMPQFDIDGDFKLSSILKQMGMEEAFSEGANFNGITDEVQADLKISEVFHKAKVRRMYIYIYIYVYINVLFLLLLW